MKLSNIVIAVVLLSVGYVFSQENIVDYIPMTQNTPIKISDSLYIIKAPDVFIKSSTVWWDGWDDKLEAVKPSAPEGWEVQSCFRCLDNYNANNAILTHFIITTPRVFRCGTFNMTQEEILVEFYVDLFYFQNSPKWEPLTLKFQ